MQSQRLIESFVGIFLILAIVSLSVLAFKVSGLTSLFPIKSYQVTAVFDDIGGLKVRAPVKMSGVQIGEVTGIQLDPVSFKAVVTIQIAQDFKKIPDDSSASILTAGLLGDNYIAIAPMYNTTFLVNGSKIEITHSAMVLEKLIGQFIYKMNNNGSKEQPSEGKTNAN